MIPKIFHRIWFGETLISTKYNQYWERWQLLHPDWEFRDWREEDIQKLSLCSVIEQVKVNAVKADIARYEILYVHGGIYLDCDIDCYQPIDELICHDDDFIVCNQIDDFRCVCSNSFFASVPQHPILDDAIRKLKETDLELINSGSPAEVTGPYFFRRVINNGKVKILASQTFYPYFHHKGDWYRNDMSSVYGVHAWAGSWLPIPTLIELAQEQYEHGDLDSCINTCEQASRIYETDDVSKSKSYLIKIRVLIVLCRFGKLLRLMLFPFILGMLSIVLFIPYIYLLPNQNFNLIGKAIRRIHRLTVWFCQKVLKTFSLKSATFQYNHILDHVFSNRDISQPIRIIEIGAMDGKSFDPLYPYLKTSSNLDVTLIEPLSEMISELRETYEGYEKRGNKFCFVEAAVVDREESVVIHTIPKHVIESEGLPEWSKGISTLSPTKTALGKPEIYSSSNGSPLSQFAVQREVKGMPLKHILDEDKIKENDILQIDTEGYDFSILNQALKLHRPKVICFEWINLEAIEKKKIVRRLLLMGYFTFLSLNGCDCIACSYSIIAKLSLRAFRDHSVVFLTPSV